MNIPKHFFTPQRTPQTTARGNPNRLGAELANAARIGNAAQDVGNMLGDLAVRKQEAVNVGQVAKVGVELTKGFSEFTMNLEKQPDESKWKEDWAKAEQKIVGNLKVSEMNPAVKQRVELMLGQWRAESGLELDKRVFAAEVERAKVDTVEAADAFLHAGNVESYKTTIREGESKGLFSKSEASKLISGAESTAAKYQATDAVLADPIKAEKLLLEKTDGGNYRNYKALDPLERQTLLRSAKVAANDVRVKTLDSLTARQMRGEVISDNELQSHVDAGTLEEVDMETVKKNQFGSRLTDKDWDAYRELRSDIAEYDPNGDGDHTALTDLRRRIFMAPESLKGELKGLLDDAADPEGFRNTAIGRQGFQVITDNLSAGFYGEFKRTYMNDDGKWVTEIDQAARQKALKLKTAADDALGDFLRDNPQATHIEVLDFIQQFNEQPVYEQAMEEGIFSGALNPLNQ